MTKNSASDIAGIVLAAGASTRMGRPKQLLKHEGKQLVALATEAVIETGATPVIVVLGAHAEQIRPALLGLSGISVVVNPAWETGIASSLGAGLRAIAHEPRDGVLVTLADQPLVTATALRRLLDAFHRGARIVASGYDGDPGVPTVFGVEHVPQLLRLSGDSGAAKWLRARAGDVTVIQGEELFDVDTPADAERLAGGLGAG